MQRKVYIILQFQGDRKRPIPGPVAVNALPQKVRFRDGT